jgi:predicted DCC family thiol-disulfide oxidoreductase YuxK
LALTRAAALRRRLVARYLTIDARSLGLGRIGLALVLIFDLLRRIPILRLFYSNEGLLPNHTLLWRPPTQWMFSFFFMASLPDEAATCFVICGLVYLALLVGWRTRLMQLLALVCVLSLHSRVTLLENGGDWMLGELALWTAFLPLGRRFSVDAVRASLRRHPEATAAELADRHPAEPGPSIAPELTQSAESPAAATDTSKGPIASGSGGLCPPEPIAGGAGPSQGPELVSAENNVVTLAAFALVLQLATSYFFNAIQKGGPTWRHGSAVHYVIYQNRMVTWFAVWMRGHLTLALSRVLSYAALATEGMLPALLLLPLPRVWSRRIAVLAIIGLHVGFQCFINLGVFSWAMIGYTPFLLTAADWSLFARLAARRGRRTTVYFDAGCGVCFQIARVLARLDVLGRLRLLSSAEIAGGQARIDGLSPELLERTIVAVDEQTSRRTTRADAAAQILRALPLGWLWSLPLRLPGLRALANLGYDVFARRRQTISIWLGLAACGVPGAPPPAARPAPTRPPIAGAFRRLWSLLREGAVLAMMVVLVSEALFINQAVPKFLKFEEPGWIKRLVAYPRLIQAWSMFASDAPLGDETVVVEAVTADGRHVDPYSEVASRYRYPGSNEIPVRLDNNSFFFNYSVRIPDQTAYHQAFLEWILAYPQRTHHPNDRIVSFEAICVENDSPPPGQTRPHNLRRRTFLSYPPHR